MWDLPLISTIYPLKSQESWGNQFPILVDNERTVDLEEWPKTGKAYERDISQPDRKRHVKREPMNVAKMFEEAMGALGGSMERASVAFTEGGEMAGGVATGKAGRVLMQRTHESLRAQMLVEGKKQTPLGRALAQWPKQFEAARATCAKAPDPLAASEVFLKEVRTFLNNCLAMADPTDRASITGNIADLPPDADIIEAVLQSMVLEPHYEGLMQRLRVPHNPKELQLEGLRRRLVGRPQIDFTIPATHVDPKNWELSRGFLSQMNSSRTALGQLGCIVRAAKGICKHTSNRDFQFLELC